jgi:hypothetical protein
MNELKLYHKVEMDDESNTILSYYSNIGIIIW